MVSFTDQNIEHLFGVEDAENERPNRLKEFFFKNRAYDNLTADLPIRIIVGHKGVGKSALLRIAFLEDHDTDVLPLWLRPSDFIDAVPTADHTLAKLADLWREELTHIVAREVLSKLGSTLSERWVKGAARTAHALVEQLHVFLRARLADQTERIEQELADKFLQSKRVRIYLDDLDRGWEAKPEHIRRISGLLKAMRDLCGSDNNLQFRLGLRSDVYFLVRTSDESTDKIERSLIWLTWENHEILTLMAKRVSTFFGDFVDEKRLIHSRQSEIARRLDPIIEPRFLGSGKWENAPMHRVLLSLIRRRPRDLIKLFYAAARAAYRNDHEIITTTDLRSVFEQYSTERLQDVINEFHTELPGIAYLVHGMRPIKRQRETLKMFSYANDALNKRIRNIMQQHPFRFTDNSRVTPQSLAEFLYKIDFLIARRVNPDGEIVRRYFDQSRYLASQYVDYGFQWEVHPAYRWALQPMVGDAIFRTVDL